MKLIVTLHLMPIAAAADFSNPEDWKQLVEEALEQLPGVDKAEVEPEPTPDKGIGEQ